MKKIEIHSFIGVIGSGKDFRANKLHEQTGAPIFDFSDGVREFTFSFLGVTPPKTEEEYAKFKGTVYSFLVDNVLYHREGRNLLENVAETLREYNPRFWANLCTSKLEKSINNCEHTIFIANSCRLLEEATALEYLTYKYGAETKYTFCDFKSPRYEIRDHESENLAQEFLKRGFKDGDDITKFVKQLVQYGEFNQISRN